MTKKETATSVKFEHIEKYLEDINDKLGDVIKKLETVALLKQKVQLLEKNSDENKRRIVVIEKEIKSLEFFKKVIIGGTLLIGFSLTILSNMGNWF